MDTELEVVDKDSSFTMLGVTPKNIEQAMELCTMMADSDFVPKHFKGKPGDVLIAIQMGSEVGLKALQSLQNIAVINGRPTLWGDAVRGLIRASRVCTGFHEFFEGEEGTANFVAVCVATRSDDPDPITHRFSVKDAERANLWGKQGPWTSYPKVMLANRACGFVARHGFADVLKGLVVREEAMDYVVETTAKPPRYAEAPRAVVPLNKVEDGATSPVAEEEAVECIDQKDRRTLFGVGRGNGLNEDDIRKYIADQGYSSTSEIPKAALAAILRGMPVKKKEPEKPAETPSMDSMDYNSISPDQELEIHALREDKGIPKDALNLYLAKECSVTRLADLPEDKLGEVIGWLKGKG